MQYDGISKPEEKTENKAEHGLLEAIESAFNVWLSSTIMNVHPFDLIFKIKDNETDVLFNEVQHITTIESAVEKIKAHCVMNYGIR